MEQTGRVVETLYLWGISMIELSIETKLYIEARGLPTEEILMASFFPMDEFYETVFENEKYLVVAYDDSDDSEIGINEYGNVYLFGWFGNSIGNSKIYVSRSLVQFIKLLLTYQSFRPLLVNCSEEKLKTHTSKFRKMIEHIDKTALKNSETYWSGILEHMCMYPPDKLLW